MALNLQAVCQFALLSLCCLLTAVREADGTYVPGRCLCPETTKRIRGQLTDLKVYPTSATCSNSDTEAKQLKCLLKSRSANGETADSMLEKSSEVGQRCESVSAEEETARRAAAEPPAEGKEAHQKNIFLTIHIVQQVHKQHQATVWSEE
ncbi:hypothetical protein CCH79_00001601, partial [Gambusia affinis]